MSCRCLRVSYRIQQSSLLRRVPIRRLAAAIQAAAVRPRFFESWLPMVGASCVQVPDTFEVTRDKAISPPSREEVLEMMHLTIHADE